MIRVTNHRLEITREKGQKSKEILEKRKAEAMVIKQRRARRDISLSSKDEDERDIEEDIDLDKADDKYPLLL